MTLNQSNFLPENQLIGRIQNLERILQQQRTAQSANLDVQTPTQASVVTVSIYNVIAGGVWEDIPDLTTNVTVTASSVCIANIGAALFATALLGSNDTAVRVAVDGVGQTDECRFSGVFGSPVDEGGSFFQSYSFTLTPGTHTLKGQVKSYAGTGAVGTNATLAYWIFRQ